MLPTVVLILLTAGRSGTLTCCQKKIWIDLILINEVKSNLKPR